MIGKGWTKRPEATNPLHVALTWWTALTGGDRDADVLERLTHSPAAFGDYAWANSLRSDLSIASKVYYAVDDPEHVAFVRFVPGVTQSSPVFADFTTNGGAHMTVCKDSDGTWRVWGLEPR